MRKKCKICGRYFWTLDPNRETCDDPSHTPYSFFKEKPTSIDYVDFWQLFRKFFEQHGHTIINRYPVVSRWRQDLYFTIAGIQDFQRIENGVISFEYPANPLLVPQICLRFNDIENVGVTGRHFTSFMMANQTSFNWPSEGYWKDETIQLNFDFLTKVIGIRKEDLVYHEDVWAMPDFSEFGPSLETFSKGLEIVNSVFTQFGLSNGKVEELKSKAIDVGWGFERALWYYTGQSNAYLAAFGEIAKKVAEESGISFEQDLYSKFSAYAGSLDTTEIKNVNEQIENILSRSRISREDYESKIKPLQAVYAVIDHVRTILFAITDGALPSNIGGGYNLRVLLRRVFEFYKQYGIKPSITEIVGEIAEQLRGLYPELLESLDTLDKVVNVEEARYNESIANARKLVEGIFNKKKELSIGEVRTLYESNGVTPELITKIAEEKHVQIKLPENMYSAILESDMVKKEKEKGKAIDLDVEGISPTKPLYYDFATSAQARVVASKGQFVVLDQTPFYPEGGGQLADTGTIGNAKVIDVQKKGNVIVHILESPAEFKIGETVVAKVNEDRRNRLMVHHTAAHLISAAARQVLGKHAWQEGAMKGPDKAHIDIAHYEKLSSEQIEAIENLVNNWILSGIKVNVSVMKRNEAEGKYGFSIYQGHGVPAKEMRIVTIQTLDNKLIDAEACGGLHVMGREFMLGTVKILSSSRIHDGVDRIEFVAGKAALEYFQKEHLLMQSISSVLNSEIESVEKKLAKFISSNEAKMKEFEKSVEELASSLASAYSDEKKINLSINVSRDLLVKIADAIVSKNEKAIVLLTNKNNEIVCIAGNESGESAIDYVKAKYPVFKGGGNKRFASGKMGV